MRFSPLAFIPILALSFTACSPSAQAGPTAAEASAAPTPIQPTCITFEAAPTPGVEEASLFPPPGEGDWTRGPAEAAVTITEYGDFQ